MTLACNLFKNKNLNGEPFNFGPPANQNHSVEQLVNEMIKHWPNAKWIDSSEKNQFPHEAGLLKLNCDKALHGLKWNATLNFQETAKWTTDWYKNFYDNGSSKNIDLSLNQIDDYMDIASSRKSFSIK